MVGHPALVRNARQINGRVDDFIHQFFGQAFNINWSAVITGNWSLEYGSPVEETSGLEGD